MAPLAYLLYASVDAADVAPFLKRVQALCKKGLLRIWHPGLLRAGDDGPAIAQAMAESAEFLLVFVSPDLDPEEDPVWSTLERRTRRREIRPLPILLRKCAFADTPWGLLQHLPRQGTPVGSWSNKDEAWTTVLEEFAEVLGAPGEPPPEQARRSVVQSIGVLLDRRRHWETFTRHCQAHRHTLTLVTGPPNHGLPFFVSRIRHHLPEQEDLLLVVLQDEWERLPARSAAEWSNALRRSLAERLHTSGTLVRLLQDATHHQGLLLLWPKPLERHLLPRDRREGLRELLTVALPKALGEAAPRHPVRAVLPLHYRSAQDDLLAWGRCCLGAAAPLSACEIPVEEMPSWPEVRDSIAERRPSLDAEQWYEIETYFQQEIASGKVASFAALVELLDQYV